MFHRKGQETSSDCWLQLNNHLLLHTKRLRLALLFRKTVKWNKLSASNSCKAYKQTCGYEQPDVAVGAPVHCREMGQMAFKGPLPLKPFYDSTRCSLEIQFLIIIIIFIFRTGNNPLPFLVRNSSISTGTEGLWYLHRFRGKGTDWISISLQICVHFLVHLTEVLHTFISCLLLQCTAFSTRLEYLTKKIFLRKKNKLQLDGSHAPPHSTVKIN